MRLLLIVLFVISGLKPNALTQKEALEQVKGMDEKEYVERSLKTILYLHPAGFEETVAEENDKDDFLPVELYLNYDIQTLYKECNSYAEERKNFEYYDENLLKKLYTDELLERIKTYPVRFKTSLSCQIKDYYFIYYSCSEFSSYSKSKAETISLKDDTAIIKLTYIRHPDHFGLFTLKKQNGIWKLDKVECNKSKECSIKYF